MTDAQAERLADKLADDDIVQWWRAGGRLADTADLVTARGLGMPPSFRPPTPAEVRSARVRIARAIIADRLAHEAKHRRLAVIAILSVAIAAVLVAIAEVL